MTFDPKDMLDELYGFGECKERMVKATVTCECFKNESVKVWVTVRKRDDDEIDQYLGKNPQSVRSTAVGMNNGEICSVQIDMDIKR